MTGPGRLARSLATAGRSLWRGRGFATSAIVLLAFGRLSLGATPATLRRMVLGEALVLAMRGGAVGLVLVAAGARLLDDLLFQVHPYDPMTLLVATGVLLLAAATACLAPAGGAARVDPAVLLRDL